MKCKLVHGKDENHGDNISMIEKGACILVQCERKEKTQTQNLYMQTDKKKEIKTK